MSRLTLFVLLLIPCAILAKCPAGQKTAVCKENPCKGVLSPYCEPEKCGKCGAVCYDKKGGSQLPCYFKDCPKGTDAVCPFNGCDLIMGQRCKISCSHCEPICFDAQGQQVDCKYMTF